LPALFQAADRSLRPAVSGSTTIDTARLRRD
jgi:hypothetical protein